MQHSACKDALQGVHNSITDMVKEVANEPSVGLYFVQQHVHKAVPGLLALKSHVIEGTEEAILYTQDVNDALASVKVMNEVGPPVFSKMISTLNASLQLLPTLYQSKTSRLPPAYAHLPRSATHHGALPSSQPGTRSGVLSESSIPEATGKSSPAVSSPAEVLQRSSSVQGNTNSSSTTPTDTSSFVSGLLSSAYQRASSVRMSMPVAFEVKERIAKQDNATETSTTPDLSANNTSTSGSNAGFIPSIPYWNVFESAIQKAGHMVGAGSLGMSDSSRRSHLVRSFSASNLPDSAHKKPEASDFEGSSARGEQEGLEKEDDKSELDLEDPLVVESYARLQEEQAAKLEAWLGDSKEDDEATTPQSCSLNAQSIS